MLAKERAQPFSPTTLAPTRTTTQMSKTMESRKAYCTVFVTQPSHPNRTTCMYSCLFEHSINPISYSYIWQQSIFTNLPSIFLRYFLSMMLTLMMRIVLATVFCRFGSWGLAKLLFRLWAQGLVKILKLKFRQDLYGEKIFYVGKKLVKLPTLATLVTHWLTHSVTNFPTICLWRDADVWLRFWS